MAASWRLQIKQKLPPPADIIPEAELVPTGQIKWAKCNDNLYETVCYPQQPLRSIIIMITILNIKMYKNQFACDLWLLSRYSNWNSIKLKTHWYMNITKCLVIMPVIKNITWLYKMVTCSMHDDRINFCYNTRNIWPHRNGFRLRQNASIQSSSHQSIFVKVQNIIFWIIHHSFH